VLPTDAGAIARRDADFLSVRTKAKVDRSGRRGDPADKYFHESVFNAHYDGRFADKVLPAGDSNKHLVRLIQAYLSTMVDIGVETWLAHGSLLGWWWNRKIMPWDSDIDVQVSEPTMHFLASYYNMTIYHYKTPGQPRGRDYLLEVNPHYLIRGREDRLNVIDARWIDTESGLFIDITTVRKNETHPVPGTMACKDGHSYREADLFPLRDSDVEGVPVKIPYAYGDILIEEYGSKALTRTKFLGHEFNREKMEWIPVKQPKKAMPARRPARVPSRKKPPQ
jgi:hypothetical protein